MADKADEQAPKVTADIDLNMPLDPERKRQIEECLKKGHLKLKLTKVDIGKGRIEESWLYD